MKQKLLVVGTFGASALENVYIHNFKKIGLTPYTFDVFSGFHDQYASTIRGKMKHKLDLSMIRKSINDSLLRFDTVNSPEVVLIFKGADLTYDTINELKSRGRYLVNYNPDHPYFFERKNLESQNIFSSIGLYDLYISYAQKVVETIKSQYKIDSIRVPFGFDDRMTIQKTKSQSNAISFIGKWDKKRASFLKRINHEKPVKIYGDSDWVLRTLWNPIIKSRYQNEYLSGQRFSEVIQESSAVINLLRLQNLKEDSHNMRTFEVPGNGGLLLAERTSDQESFFEDGKEALYFDSQEELNDKVEFLLKNKAYVLKLKSAAFKRSIDSKYSYYYRAMEITEAVKKAF